MHWNRPAIEAEQRGIAHRLHAESSQAELLDEIVRLRCALYPFTTTLGSLDSPAPRGVMATSALFPCDLGEGKDAGKLAVDVSGTGTFAFVEPVSRTLHEHEYEQRESLTVDNGARGETLMDDAVCVMQVHSYWTGAYANCGLVTMGDVRMAVEAMRS